MHIFCETLQHEANPQESQIVGDVLWIISASGLTLESQTNPHNLHLQLWTQKSILVLKKTNIRLFRNQFLFICLLFLHAISLLDITFLEHNLIMGIKILRWKMHSSLKNQMNI